MTFTHTQLTIDLKDLVEIYRHVKHLIHINMILLLIILVHFYFHVIANGSSS